MSEPTRLSPDARRAMRTSVLSIGVAVAVTAAVLVAGVLGVTALYLWLQSSPGEQLEPAKPGDLRLSIDAGHVLLGLALVGAAAVVIAGVATVAIARRAVRPLEDAFARQRRFVADASHELRTPLTVLHARIQLLQRRVGPDSPAAPIAVELADDAQALITILNDLIEVSDEPAAPATDERADLAAVLQAALDTMQPSAAEREVTIRVVGSTPAVVRMRAPQLRRCVLALLDSALEHSPAGTTVTVAVAPAGRFVCLDVHDEGPAVTGAEAERIFDRFAHRPADPTAAPRAPSTTRPHRTGSGLGLFLVRETVTRHGGSVAVVPGAGPGSTIRLLLPAG